MSNVDVQTHESQEKKRCYSQIQSIDSQAEKLMQKTISELIYVSSSRNKAFSISFLWRNII